MVIYYEISTKIYHGFRDTEKAATILLQIGKIQLERGEHKKAAMAYSEACKLFEAKDNAKGAAVSLLNLTGVLELAGQEKENKEKIKQLYRRAHQFAKEAGFKAGIDIAAKKLSER